MRKKKALWITITIAAILLVMGAVVIAKPSQARILPEGISFNGNSLAGLTPDEAKEKITEYMSYYNDRTIELTIGDEVKTITMEDIGLTIDGEENALAELNEAIPYGNVLQRYKQEKDLEQEPVDIKASVSYNEETLSNLITQLVAKYEVPVAEPTYKKTSTGFVTTSGSNGIAYDEAQIISDLKKHLEETIPSSGESGVIQYTAQSTVTTPNMPIGSYDDLKDNVLGTYTTKFDASNVDRTTNLELACQHLNGTVIMPNQSASLLDILQVSYATGYKDAGTIINGKTEMDLGGGVCQVATTLYDALIHAEVEVTYRRNHSLASDYVDYSWDAMIHPGSNSDFKFRNNLDHPIYIEAGIARNGENSKITVTIYGTEYRAANRTIEYYTKVLSKEYIKPLYIVKRYTADTLPEEGKNYVRPRLYAQRQVTASPTVKAQLWKRVIVDGVVVEDKKFNESSYKGTQGIMYLSWDMTMLTWITTDENGFEVANYAFRDGRYWDPSKETEIDLSIVETYPWVGQNLNEDGSVKKEETTTVAPTTQAPTTEAPTTTAPTTTAPTTTAPTTEEPTTVAPTTQTPTTEAPTTEEPTTVAPTTQTPTTEAPTTAEPTTVVPEAATVLPEDASAVEASE